VSLTFLLLIDALGRGGAFFFYAAICVVTFIFCKRLVPETKGKRLEDITAVFEERVERHRPPVAPSPPDPPAAPAAT
jgi:major inositol transporter-like SP family MFS transporter